MHAELASMLFTAVPAIGAAVFRLSGDAARKRVTLTTLETGKGHAAGRVHFHKPDRCVYTGVPTGAKVLVETPGSGEAFVITDVADAGGLMVEEVDPRDTQTVLKIHRFTDVKHSLQTRFSNIDFRFSGWIHNHRFKSTSLMTMFRDGLV